MFVECLQHACCGDYQDELDTILDFVFREIAWYNEHIMDFEIDLLNPDSGDLLHYFWAL